MNSRCGQEDWNPNRQCGQVLSEIREGADDELARPDGPDFIADFDHDTAVLVPHVGGAGHILLAAIRPEVETRRCMSPRAE